MGCTCHFLKRGLSCLKNITSGFGNGTSDLDLYNKPNPSLLLAGRPGSQTLTFIYGSWASLAPQTHENPFTFFDLTWASTKPSLLLARSLTFINLVKENSEDVFFSFFH